MTQADMPTFVGVVPACGASRRMGRDKALLRLGRRTFLEHVVTALDEGGCGRVVVVVATDAPTIEEHARGLAVEVLVNPDPGDDPITSLRLALDHLDRGGGEAGRAPADGVVWLPLDYPLIRGDHVSMLLAEARASGAPLTLPVHGAKRGHPALFTKTLFGALRDPTLQGGARTVVHATLADARLVRVEDPAYVTDVDTPEAYDALMGRTGEVRLG